MSIEMKVSEPIENVVINIEGGASETINKGLVVKYNDSEDDLTLNLEFVNLTEEEILITFEGLDNLLDNFRV